LTLFEFLETQGETFTNGLNPHNNINYRGEPKLMDDNTKSTFLKALIRAQFPSLPNGQLSIRRKVDPPYEQIMKEKGTRVPEIACNKIRYQIDRLEKELKIINSREEDGENVDEEMDALMTKKIKLMDDLEELDHEITLHEACHSGDIDCVASILDVENAPELVNCPDVNGDLPLNIAIKEGHLHLARYLIAACRARVDFFGLGGHTPLHEACRVSASKEIITLLLNNGADPTAANSYGETPLHFASRNDEEHNGAIEALLMYGAHVDSETTKGKYTPLMFAAGAGQVESVYCLLEHGADPNLRNSSYHTAVIRADAADHHDCVEAIINFKPGEHHGARKTPKKGAKGGAHNKRGTIVKKATKKR